MKYLLLFSIFHFSFFISFSQNVEMGEKTPANINGVEYGYIVKNEQTKSASKEEFSRFEITLYATNKSGCTKLYADRPQDASGVNINTLVTFTCTNANGKRLTAKNGKLNVKDFNVRARVNGVDVQVKAGYIFRNGETIRNSIIVLVPLNEKPVFQAMVEYLPELQ